MTTTSPSSWAPQDLPEPDAADIIAGALQCSRGYAYTVMERALADRYPAAARQEAVPATSDEMRREVQRLHREGAMATFAHGVRWAECRHARHPAPLAQQAAAVESETERDAARYRFMRLAASRAFSMAAEAYDCAVDAAVEVAAMQDDAARTAKAPGKGGA